MSRVNNTKKCERLNSPQNNEKNVYLNLIENLNVIYAGYKAELIMHPY